MPKRFKCPGCGKVIKAPDSAAGKKVKCPSCATVMKVPGQALTPQTPPSDPFGALPGTSPTSSSGGASSAFPSAPGGQNPYSTPPSNPYSAPQTNPYGSAPPASGSALGNPLAAPGIILCVIGGIHLLLAGLNMIFMLIGLVTALQDGNSDLVIAMVIQIALGLVTFAIQGAITYGGYCMTRLEKKVMVRVALILSVIPFCSTCLILGIPFGVWGLVVMPQVESRFRS